VGAEKVVYPAQAMIPKRLSGWVNNSAQSLLNSRVSTRRKAQAMSAFLRTARDAARFGPDLRGGGSTPEL
jgi:hypothetical protein